MRSSWNRGLTKDDHPSLARIARIRKTHDNFATWRNKMRAQGALKTEYPPLVQNGNLAELVGVVLGDGHIGKHARCDSLRITANASNKGFILRYATLVERVFGKKPAVAKVKASNAVIITIYERHIARRLDIPHGARADLKYRLPSWIRRDRALTIRFLRGLYEAEGCIAYHPPTYTHKLLFANKNDHLLHLVASLVRGLGFTCNISCFKVQVSRKEEVQKLKDLIGFRRY